jgi:hypothetical protein
MHSNFSMNTMDGTVLVAAAASSGCVRDLKESIERTHPAFANSCLFILGHDEEIAAGVLLASLPNATDGGPCSLFLLPKPPLQVCVKMYKKPIMIDCHEGDTVGQIFERLMVADEYSLQSFGDDVELMFQGRLLEHDDAIADVGIAPREMQEGDAQAYCSGRIGFFGSLAMRKSCIHCLIPNLAFEHRQMAATRTGARTDAGTAAVAAAGGSAAAAAAAAAAGCETAAAASDSPAAAVVAVGANLPPPPTAAAAEHTGAGCGAPEGDIRAQLEASRRAARVARAGLRQAETAREAAAARAIGAYDACKSAREASAAREAAHGAPTQAHVRAACTTQRQLMLELKYGRHAEAAACGVAMHRGVVCDGCGAAPIQGIRYKSTAAYDFDLCAGCEGGAAFEGSHGPFLKIARPVLEPAQLREGPEATARAGGTAALPSAPCRVGVALSAAGGGVSAAAPAPSTVAGEPAAVAAKRRRVQQETAQVYSAVSFTFAEALFAECGGDYARVAAACGMEEQKLRERHQVDVLGAGRRRADRVTCAAEQGRHLDRARDPAWLFATAYVAGAYH